MHLKRNRLGKGLSRRRSSVIATMIMVLGVIVAGPSAVPAAAEIPAHTDVLFVFDTSGSMSGELEEAKTDILTVMEESSATLPDMQFGVSEVRDDPFSEEGIAENIEKAWKLDQPITADRGAVKTAIEPLFASGGGDGPEAYGRALFEADTNPNVGWREGAKHVIILVADNVPHDNELNEGLPESEWVEPNWDTGEELQGPWGIPGTVWPSAPSHDFQTIMRQLNSDGKPLESVEFFGGEHGYLPYWEYWAGLAGGKALDGASGELASKVTTLIKEGATTPLPTCPTGQERGPTGACIVKPTPTSHPTATQLICNLIIATATDTCTATVGDAAPTGSTNPSGTVTFTSAGGGVFVAGNTCALVNTPLSGNTSSCSVQFLPPTTAVAPTMTATYSGDSTHNSSSGSTHYGTASSLETLVDLSEAGTIHIPDVEIPITCQFPCDVTGSLLSGPDLGTMSSVASVSLEAVTARKHGKHKAKPKPVLFGKGSLKLTKPGKGKLIIKLTPKGRHALGHVGANGVRLTLKYTVTTPNGTLVTTKTKVIRLKPAPKHKKGHKKH